MTIVRILPSPDALLSDYRAALDTYALEISLPGIASTAGEIRTPRNRVFLREPLYCIEALPLLNVKPDFAAGPGTIKDAARQQFQDIPAGFLYHSVVKLIDAGQRHQEDGDPPSRRRWPFTVERQLIVDIEITRGLFWTTTFEPGTEYQEIECRANG